MNRQELAQKCDQCIRQASAVIAKGSLMIGWYGSILKEKNLFRELGFADEDAYYRSCGLGRSTWFRAVEIAQAFRVGGIDRDKVLSMKIENARMLAKAPESIRFDQSHVAAASSELCRDFELRMKRVCPQTNLGVLKIRRTALVVEMTDRERKEINSVIDEWINRHHVADRGKALLEIVRFASDMMASKKTA